MTKIFTAELTKGLRLLLTISVILIYVNNIQAQTTVTVGGGAVVTCPAAPPTATWTTPPTGVTFSNWFRGSGVSCASIFNGLAGSGFNALSATASFTANKYYGVTITADATHSFVLTSVMWAAALPGGSCSFDIQYSNNGGPISTFGTAGTNITSNTFNGNVVVAAGTSIILYFIPWNTAIGTKIYWRNGSTITLNTAKYWIGYGAGGTNTQTDLGTAANWSPGLPAASDTGYMNFGSYTGTFNLTQSISGLSMSALNITMAGTSTSATTKTTIDVNQNFSPGALSITNSSSGSKNDEIDFNVTGGTTTCSSVSTTASGTSASPNLYINVTSSLICNGSWSSSALDNNTVSTYIKNSGTLTINGVDSIYNSKLSQAPILFLVDDNPATTTFNSRVRLGSNTKGDYNGNNGVLLGGYNNTSTGQFIFNTNNDSVVIGYNMGTDNFKKGSFFFTGTGLAIGSYAKTGSTPDRSPGTFQIGTVIPADVSFTTIGDNSALTVYNFLTVSSNSVFTVRAAVIPAEIANKATIQLNPYSTLNLGVNQGASSSLPTNYLNYYFDPTSTVNYAGNTQNVYSGANYGNLTLSNTGIKRAGGSITVLGNLLITDAAVFDLNNTAFNNSNNFTDTVGGNWTNNSTDASGGIVSTGTGKVTVMFNGSSNATIGGNNPNTFYGIRIDKTSGTALTMNQNVTVTDVDSFTNGALAINGNMLSLGGTIVTANGTISGSLTSNLVSGASGTVKFTQSGFNNYLKVFTVNSSSITLGNALNIAAGTFANPGVLTANATLNTGGFLTLKSDANGDVRVASSTGNIYGNVTVERYIPANRAWRFLTFPFGSSTQTINGAWQEGAVPYPSSSVSLYQDIQHNPKPNYGTEITYLHNTNASGFDENVTENPSLKTWDYVTKTWSVAAPNTLSSNILDYQAYCLFVRGDRSIDLATGVYASPNATTLRATGVLNQINNGNAVIKNFGSRSAGEFIFVGNPYASAVNLESVLNNSTGIDKTTFWVWDPGVTTGNDVGAYVTYNTTTGISAPAGSTYSGGKFAQSGQAFFVKASGGVPMVSFSESDKTASETNVYSRQKAPVYAVIYTNLMGSTGNGLIDGVAFAFDKQFSATVDADDATKLWNFNENISLVRDTKNLAIEFRPKPGAADTMFFRLYLRKDQSYALKFFAQNLKGIAKNARLIDKYLNAETKIDLSDTALFNFNTNADTNSYRNRFMLILNPDNNQVTGYPTIYANVRAPFESSSELVDGVAAGFSNEFAAVVDGDDAQKIWNFNENMSLARDGKNLAIEFRPKPANTDTLFFKLWLRQNQPYSLQVYSRNIADNFKGQTVLVDKYLNTEIPVNLFDTTLYAFTPGADTNSYRNRFMLVYKGEDKPAKSSAVIAHTGSITAGIKVFPNPATGEKVTLQFSNMQQGNYEITAFNHTGEKLFGTKISHAGGNNAYRLSLNSMWAAGIYTIKILHEGSKKEINLPLVISK